MGFRASATHEIVASLVAPVQPESHKAVHDPPNLKDAPQPCELGGLGDGPQLTFSHFSDPLYFLLALHPKSVERGADAVHPESQVAVHTSWNFFEPLQPDVCAGDGAGPQLIFWHVSEPLYWPFVPHVTLCDEVPLVHPATQVAVHDC